MKKNIAIPVNQITKIRIEQNGSIKFQILTKAAIDIEEGVVAGGKWVDAHVKKDGLPVKIKVEGRVLVIEQLVNAAKDLSTGEIVGGNYITIARLELCE